MKEGEAMEIFRLFGRIMIDDKEAQKSISKTDKSVEGLGSRLGGMIKTAAKWGAAIVAGAGAAGTGLFALAQKAAGTTDRIDKLSQKIGLSRQGFQEWEFILSQSGTDIEKLQMGFKTLTQRMDEVIRGTGRGAEYFNRLGVSVTDSSGALRTQEEVFEDVVRALQEMPEGAEKARLATELFGRAGQELMPLLNSASGSVDELKQKAHELGLVISDEAVDAGVVWTDTMDQLQRASDAVFTQIGVSVMPVLQQFAEWIISNMPTIQTVIQTAFEFMSTAVGWVVTAIQTVISYLSDWAAQNNETLTDIWQTAQGVLTDLGEFIRGVLGLIRDFWEQNGQQILTNAKTVFNSVKDIVTTVFEAIRTIIQRILSLVVPFIQEKLVAIQKFWNDNGKQIMQAVQNAFSFIQKVVETVMPAVLFVIETVWGMIRGVIDGALNIIMGLIKVFSGLFTGDWSKLWEGVKQLISGALQFIWNLVQLSLLGRVIGVVRSFATLLRNVISAPFNWMRNFISNILSAVTTRASTFAQGFVNAFRAIPNGIRSILNQIISGFNSLISRLNRFRINIPDWVPLIGGRSFSMNVPLLPALARGGTITKAGSVLVGEAGPEILNLPKGASVVPLDHPSLGGIDYDRLARAIAQYSKPNVVFENHFTPAESTPSQHQKKQRQLAREWGLAF